jgi:hypothetical protein
MVGRARDVTYRTLRSHVAEDLNEMFGYKRGWGLSLATDYAVSFHKGSFRGVPCYYIDHSAIEHIFTLDGEYPACPHGDGR